MQDFYLASRYRRGSSLDQAESGLAQCVSSQSLLFRQYWRLAGRVVSVGYLTLYLNLLPGEAYI